MIRKKMVMSLTSLFFLMLVGCNTNDNAVNPTDNNYSAFEFENGNGTLDVRNNIGNGSYGERNGEDDLFDTGNKAHQGNEQLGDNNQINGDISSDWTQVPSNQFPHTKAVRIESAKYQFYTVNDGKEYPFKEWAQKQNGEHAGEQKNNQPEAVTPNQEQVQQQPEAATRTPVKEKQHTETAEEVPKQQVEKEGKTPNNDQPTEGINDLEAKVIELTNAERRKEGLPDLKADTALSDVASEKSVDMHKNNYFSHTSPTYGSPFDMMRDFGISYNTAGENIAQGQRTPEEVVQAWMNSEGHRKNILSEKFTHIGVGFNEAGHQWTQMFIGK